MKLTDIYQTLENRGNDEYVQNHGLFFCSFYVNGKRKNGLKEPWLGEGYYFWDTNIEDAKWWGRTIYKSYIICQTKYDCHSPLLFDFVGDLEHIKEFFECAKFLKKEYGCQTITFPTVLNYIKKLPKFSYKAIRALPMNKNSQSKEIVVFPNNRYFLLDLKNCKFVFLIKHYFHYQNILLELSIRRVKRILIHYKF